MSLKEELLRQLKELEPKLKEREINENLARICKAMDGFTGKIKQCLDKGEDLSEDDKSEIQKLNNDYNRNIEEYKKLIDFK